MDIKRARRDRWIRGVCGGVARAYGWNSNLVRLVTQFAIPLLIMIGGVVVWARRR